MFDLSDAGAGYELSSTGRDNQALGQLKQPASKTIAWLENPGNVHLALAVACNQIVLADFGGVDMPSSSMQSMFYRDAMDLIGPASLCGAGWRFQGRCGTVSQSSDE